MRSVFVSSTFKDMHYERDAIKLIAEPLLNQEARKYGEEFYFCDLRWGINTGDLDTNEGAKKVLDVCLEEIDRCEPPMVVLLGDRYGWIPESDLIKTAADSKHFALNDLEKSVTALEIEYGALRDGEKVRNTLFYFRNIEGCPPPAYIPEDAEEEEKIRELKDSIRKMVRDITGESIREYTLTWNGNGFDGIEDFAKMLAGDIRDMLLPRWEKLDDRTSFERERIIHDTFIREKSIMFKARQAEADKLIALALSEPVTVIEGEIGGGKSTLFCHMVTELKKILKGTEWDVLPFISGLTLESNSEDDIARSIAYFMEEQLEFAMHYIDEKDPVTGEKRKHTPLDWENRIMSLYQAYQETGKKLLVMVDAVDQLAPAEKVCGLDYIAGELIHGHSSLSDCVHFVMTCAPDPGNRPSQQQANIRVSTVGWPVARANKNTGDKKLHIHELEPINQEDKLSVIDGILAKNGRELSESVIDEMTKKQCSANPLYLSLIVQRLLMMNSDDFASIMSRGDGMAAIEQHQRALIENQCPDDLFEMNAVLLDEAGKRINGKFVSRIVECIAVSRNGLNRKVLSKILGEEWAEYDFALFDHFVNYMNDCFLMRDDGCYDFSHKSIREGFLNRCKDIKGIHREILEGLKVLEADDKLRGKEIIYHTIEADDKGFLIDYIKEWKERESDQKDTSYIHYAFEELSARCIADNGQWIIDVLNDAKTCEADEKLHYLFYLCHGIEIFSKKGYEIRLSILSAAVDLFEHLYRKTDVFRRALYFSCEKIVKMCTRGGGREDLEHAWKLYRKMKETGPDMLSGIIYADKWVKLAKMYGEPDDPEKLERMEELYDECLEIWEQEESDTGYTRQELVENYSRAAEVYGKLGEIYEERAMECRVAGTRSRIVNLKRALKLYLKHLKIRKRFAVEWDNYQNSKDLSVGYIKVARVYQQLDGQEDLEHSEQLYWRGLGIKKKMEDEITREEADQEPFAFLYVYVGEIYEALGVIPNLFTWPIELSDLKGIENLEQALEWYRRGLEISVQRAKEYNRAISESNGTGCLESYYKDPFVIYDKITAVCEKMAKWYSYLETEQFGLKAELHQMVLGINEELRKELGSIEDSEKELHLKDLENKAKELAYLKKAGPEVFNPLILVGGSAGAGMMDASRAILPEKPKLPRFLISHAIATVLEHGGWRMLGISGIFDPDVNDEVESNSVLANLTQSFDAYITLVESLIKVAMHTAITVSDRKKLLFCGLDIARELYREVKMYKAESYGDADRERCKYLVIKCSEPLARQIADERFGKKPDGIEDLKPASGQRKKVRRIRKNLERISGDVYFWNGYTKASQILYREFQLPEALDSYYEEKLFLESAVALSRRYDRTSDGFEVYETLARSLFDVALKSSIAVSDKKNLLDMGLEIAKDLYEKAKMNKEISDPGRYEALVDKFSEALYDK